jgi:hypothetical protein
MLLDKATFIKVENFDTWHLQGQEINYKMKNININIKKGKEK